MKIYDSYTTGAKCTLTNEDKNELKNRYKRLKDMSYSNLQDGTCLTQQYKWVSIQKDTARTASLEDEISNHLAFFIVYW